MTVWSRHSCPLLEG